MSEKRPLEIACTTAKCGTSVKPSERRHSFTSPQHGIPGVGGTCRSCGVDLIDWSLCHSFDPSANDQLILEFRKELIRNNYWSLPLPTAVMRKARKRTTAQLRHTVDLNMRRTLIPNHPRERRQTPFAYTPQATLIPADNTQRERAVGLAWRSGTGCPSAWNCNRATTPIWVRFFGYTLSAALKRTNTEVVDARSSQAYVH